MLGVQLRFERFEAAGADDVEAVASPLSEASLQSASPLAGRAGSEGFVFWAAIWCGVGRLARGCDKVVVDGGGGTEIMADGGPSGSVGVADFGNELVGVLIAEGDFAGTEYDFCPAG